MRCAQNLLYLRMSIVLKTRCNLSVHQEWTGGFPGGTVVKNPPANARDTGLRPGLGRSHMPQSN